MIFLYLGIILILSILLFKTQLVAFFYSLFASKDKIFNDRFTLYKRSDGLLGIRDKNNPTKIIIGKDDNGLIKL